MRPLEKITGERRGMGLLLHATGWIILFILPQFLITGGSFEDIRTSLIIFFKTMVFGIIFYVNYLWLVPLLLHRKKGYWYVPAMLALVVIVHMGSNYSFRKIFPPPHAVEQQMNNDREVRRDGRRGFPSPAKMMVYNYFITAFLVTGFAIGLRSAEQTVSKEREIKELEKEKLNSELALLKNQVSPHFFFNTLNNIYSLIAINQKDAQEAVLSLSKMMRYLLYESEGGYTRLSRELEFMSGYIDLMKLRISNRVSLKVDFPEVYTDVDIPPLLFIPFIENAFKHGVSNQGNSFIEIMLKVSDRQIVFNAMNSVAVKNGDLSLEASGIGLENVRKRLALLYPGHHELKTEVKDSVFIVSLTLDTVKAG
jgi:CRISPR/Cas system CSM-associated protein Csm2 small subunit